MQFRNRPRPRSSPRPSRWHGGTGHQVGAIERHAAAEPGSRRRGKKLAAPACPEAVRLAKGGGNAAAIRFAAHVIAIRSHRGPVAGNRDGALEVHRQTEVIIRRRPATLEDVGGSGTQSAVVGAVAVDAGGGAAFINGTRYGGIDGDGDGLGEEVNRLRVGSLEVSLLGPSDSSSGKHIGRS